MKTILWYCLGTLMGLLAGFILFGLQVLPETIWTWNLPWQEPIEMQGTMATPILVRIPSGDYFVVYKYESHEDHWQLLDYTVYSDGKWGKPHNNYSFSLPISNAEVFMLPSDIYPEALP